MKQEYRTLETTLETLNEQFKLLQIEKETEVESLTKQVCTVFIVHKYKHDTLIKVHTFIHNTSINEQYFMW